MAAHLKFKEIYLEFKDPKRFMFMRSDLNLEIYLLFIPHYTTMSQKDFGKLLYAHKDLNTLIRKQTKIYQLQVVFFVVVVPSS